MNILVTGGAGYIGSVITKKLMEKGHNPFVLDNNPRSNVPGNFQGDLADTNLLEKIFKSKRIDAVIHLAGYIEVSESMREPLKYYQNNFCNTVNLVSAMLRNNVKNLVYASSAAVYGQPETVPISEDAVKNPINHYGKTKLMSEELLESCSSLGLNSVSLRFFNASGSAYSLGERHSPETHFIPLLINAAIEKKSFKVNGNDFPTKDGTCVRDFIHVLDIADAHVLALDKMKPGFNVYNIGSGIGYSVLEVIDVAKEIIGRDLEIEFGSRREGDPAELVASIEKIKLELGWEPKHGLKSIVHSALAYRILRD